MSDQATWIPLPRRRGPKAKLPDVLTRADRLIDWYKSNRPDITRMAVSDADWRALEAALEEKNPSLIKASDGVLYRNFLLYRQAQT